MNKAIFLLLVVLLPAVGVFAQEPTDSTIAETVAADDPVGDATVVALAWLAVVDKGEYGQSWTEAASLFRQAVGQTDWIEQVRNVRQPLGSVLTRERVGAEYTTLLPQAPTGEYVVIRFNTSFAGMAGATETITPMRDSDGAWRVAGYYIAP